MSNHFQPRPRPARSSSSPSAALPVATDLARRRRLLRAIAGGSMVSLPQHWSRPVVDSVLLPAHAQASAPQDVVEHRCGVTCTSAVDEFWLLGNAGFPALPSLGVIGLTRTAAFRCQDTDGMTSESVTSNFTSYVLAFEFLSTQPGTLSTAATLSVFADTGTSTSTVSLNSQSTLNSAC